MDAAAACERLPTGWLAREMIAVFQPYATTRVTVRVLAWQVDLDDRPLKVERALVWLRFAPEGKSPFFMLANLYRHPDAKGSWAKAGVTDVPHTAAERFDREPTRADLDKFLKDTWWYFKPSDGFRMTGSELCARAWQGSFGQAPWRSYPVEPKR